MLNSSLRVPLRSLLTHLINHCTYHQSPISHFPMELPSVVKALEKIAPTKLAEDWDNVGLLLEPQMSEPVKRVLITNDLTEPVLDEALSLGGVGMILPYHPPIFQSFKRLTQSSTKERIILQCAQAGIAVYSPHTSMDNMEGGINDWLLSGVGEGKVSSIGARKLGSSLANVVRCKGVDGGKVAELRKSYPQVEMQDDGLLSCSDSDLVNLLPLLKTLSPSELTVNASTDVKVVPSGGRLLRLSQPLTLTQVIQNVKGHLHLPHVRVAMPSKERPITSLATCAGSGGSVLRGVQADLYLTGEMSHHQVLEATAQGVAVILCEHSNTERGYLRGVYQEKVAESLPGVEVVCSQTDRDPLEIV